MAKKRSKIKADKVAKSLIKNDLNKAAAARELGITPQAMQKHVNENPLVRSALEKYLEALEKAGVNDEKSARVISEAMDATRKVGLGHGEDFTVETEDDHHARLKANEQYLKLKRLLTPEKNGGDKPPEQHMHFHFGDKNTNEILGSIFSQLTSLGGGKPSIPGRGAAEVRD